MKYLLIVSFTLLLILSGCSRVDVPVNNNSINQSFTKVIFTFDDGTLDQYAVGYPILDKYDYNATLFVITGLINETFENRSMMSWNDVHTMADDGWDIESHSYSHPFLTQISIKDAELELSASKKYLEGQGFNVSILAFPYGDYNDEVFSLAKQYYPFVRGSSDGYNSNVSNPDYLNSKWTVNTTTIDDMKSWLDTAIENDSWLIVMVHRVSDDHLDEFSVKPEVLEGFVDYIHQKNIPVKTLSEVLLE